MFRYLATLALLLSAFAFSGSQAHTATTMISCAGAPSEYVAAFDTVRGQAKDGAVKYPYATWYDEQQNWATHAGEVPGHHSEHVHIGRCIPNGQTVGRRIHSDVEVTFHNMTDYAVVEFSSSMLCCDSNSGPSDTVYSASATELAELQAGLNASAGGQTTHVFQSQAWTNPTTNGFKEVRTGMDLRKSGDTAIFLRWIVDPYWYMTANYPDLPFAAAFPDGQIAVRNRAHVFFPEPGNPSNIVSDYSHGGWGGLKPRTACGESRTAGSAQFTRSVIWNYWADGRSKTPCLYVTDGGGPALLMIDPDFHHHYDAPTASCPNVDTHGNCLGRWFWRNNDLFSGSGTIVNMPVKIPASVITALPAGKHRLVFLHHDEGDCARQGVPCPPDMRGIWTDVSVLPFRVK